MPTPDSPILQAIEARRRVTNLLTIWCIVLSVLLLASIGVGTAGWVYAGQVQQNVNKRAAIRQANVPYWCDEINALARRARIRTISCLLFEESNRVLKPVSALSKSK